MNTFSGEVLGHDKIPFLSVQHNPLKDIDKYCHESKKSKSIFRITYVTDPRVCTRFSVLDKYSPLPRIALTKDALREE